jgi:hypothetical protein
MPEWLTRTRGGRNPVHMEEIRIQIRMIRSQSCGEIGGIGCEQDQGVLGRPTFWLQ